MANLKLVLKTSQMLLKMTKTRCDSMNVTSTDSYRKKHLDNIHPTGFINPSPNSDVAHTHTQCSCSSVYKNYTSGQSQVVVSSPASCGEKQSVELMKLRSIRLNVIESEINPLLTHI